MNNMKMPDKEYNEALKMVKNWAGTKEELQSFYDNIYNKYEDGRDIIRRLDQYQRKWTMNLH